MEENANVMTEMDFGRMIIDILDNCHKLEFDLEFGGDHCVLDTGKLRLPFYNLERLQGFLEGIDYALGHMVEDDDEG